MSNKKVVWKVSIPIEDKFTLMLPANATVLCVQVQNNRPCIWFLCNSMASEEPRQFRLFGTGHAHDESLFKGNYVGTFQINVNDGVNDGSLVFHLFEGIVL